MRVVSLLSTSVALTSACCLLELDCVDTLIEPDIYPIISSRRGERLVEIVPGHLEGLGPLAGKHVRKTKPFARRTLKEECGILGLVAAGHDSIE